MRYYGYTINIYFLEVNYNFSSALYICIAFIESSPSSTEFLRFTVVYSQSFSNVFFSFRVRNLLSGIIGISHAHNRFLHKYLPHCTHTHWKLCLSIKNIVLYELRPDFYVFIFILKGKFSCKELPMTKNAYKYMDVVKLDTQWKRIHYNQWKKGMKFVFK